MGSPFIFKQFSLEQGQSAFKLGTDSVLLGAWLPGKCYKRILDIGAGTGILSLMIAQRFAVENIISVELDAGTYVDLANNFAQSGWKDRLRPIHEDVLVWSAKNPQEKFDLLISNPPYFTNDLQNPDTRKAGARHTGRLNAQSMTHLIIQHLTEEGYFGCILPSFEFDQWTNILEEKGMYLCQVCHVRSFQHSDIVRKMGLFSLKKTELISDDQFIYNPDRKRSDWYRDLTVEFYIK